MVKNRSNITISQLGKGNESILQVFVIANVNCEVKEAKYETFLGTFQSSV